MPARTAVLPEIAERGYAHPESLVTTSWVAEHLKEPSLKVVEVDVDTAAYDDAHIPGAIGWNWKTQLMDLVQRDLAMRDDFEKLLRESGISNDDTIVLYGDNNNWFAAYAYWQLEYYGHSSLRLMDGGRAKWLSEGREVTRERTRIETSDYKVRGPFEGVRAYRQDVERAVKLNLPLVDVRSPDEFTGRILAPPGLPETAQRGGHIPGARNVPWSRAVNEDGTFKNRAELQKIYVSGQDVTGDTQVIAYCRIGERSSHTWFVLKYLLGFRDVKNYDGSWTEWGNLVGAPIER
ncbi:MAG: sulfurtransferase [Gemmatimonadetes bacterium]|nr:sulfurtransferase [Gemmatimonadota bacterium]NIO33376.1 sulfurtransferase [Gemmatimonadota bacterium]